MAEFTALLHASPFYELAALLTLAAAVACVGGLLRQPIVVSFIAVGILAGPSGLDLVHSHEKINLLAELGIALAVGANPQQGRTLLGKPPVEGNIEILKTGHNPTWNPMSFCQQERINPLGHGKQLFKTFC